MKPNHFFFLRLDVAEFGRTKDVVANGNKGCFDYECSNRTSSSSCFQSRFLLEEKCVYE
jgi:hypothetical protein